MIFYIIISINYFLIFEAIRFITFPTIFFIGLVELFKLNFLVIKLVANPKTPPIILVLTPGEVAKLTTAFFTRLIGFKLS